ncbi:3-isopropylmalate dehydratase large subunit [Striga asiatica]|uniref:3-isopropylmalate dehydratase large subunit n=1 Tax=Striga asiatica TaxID=4170 RepID=A0A5A7NXT2_STRAF|nr:3-isopropylmalate dehydratase large subunit [Striga asiatica]
MLAGEIGPLASGRLASWPAGRLGSAAFRIDVTKIDGLATRARCEEKDRTACWKLSRGAAGRGITARELAVSRRGKAFTASAALAGKSECIAGRRLNLKAQARVAGEVNRARGCGREIAGVRGLLAEVSSRLASRHGGSALGFCRREELRDCEKWPAPGGDETATRGGDGDGKDSRDR